MQLEKAPFTRLVPVLLTAWFLAATLPYLADFPYLDWPQMGIVAPAAKLADEGVYGNDLFAGFYDSETRNYEYMPAYPLLVAGSFKLFGTTVTAARLASIFCAALVVLLTYLLGRKLHSPTAGLIAATVLCVVRLGLFPETSGIPLLDFARVVRYDILVPVGVLAATLFFLWADERTGRARAAGLIAAGAGAGLATLGHVYGVFILAVFAATLLWQRGWRVVLQPAPYLLAAGWTVAMAPWILYVLQDTAAYAGQMSRHEGRFDFFSLGFYLDNLKREPWRYTAWLQGGFPWTFLRPRPGLWTVTLGLPAAFVLLWHRARGGTLKDRLLWLTLPVLALCLGLFIFMKRYAYTILVLPFIALWLAVVAVELWRWTAARRSWRIAVVVAAVLVIVEGAVGVSGMLRIAAAASDYSQLGTQIAEPIPAGTRLLIAQPYWLGLERAKDFDLRSVNMVFLLTKTMTVEQALDRLDPEGVVIESYFFDPESTDPRGPPPTSDNKRVFLQVADYLDRHCSEIQKVDDPDYGEVLIYLSCHSA